MDLLFELLQELDSGSERIILFADEAGAWQVSIDSEKVLPAYVTSLAAVTELQAYADRVAELSQPMARMMRRNSSERRAK